MASEVGEAAAVQLEEMVVDTPSESEPGLDDEASLEGVLPKMMPQPPRIPPPAGLVQQVVLAKTKVRGQRLIRLAAQAGPRHCQLRECSPC